MKILLSGCTGGYGKAIAKIGDKLGYSVYGIARNERKLKEMLGGGLIKDYFVCDFSSSSSLAEKLESFISKVNPQIIINNAGIGSKGNTIKKETMDALLETFQVNVIAPFEIVKIASSMDSSKLEMVFNISSRRGSFYENKQDLTSKKCSYSYRITKAAQNMLSQCMHEDQLLKKVKIFSIHPGKLKTNLGVSSAALDPEISASRLLSLIENTSNEGNYFSLEESEIKKLNF